MQSEGLKSAADVSKLIITLCTGAVAFTVTFLDKFTQHEAKDPVRLPHGLVAAWVLFGLSILFAVWTLMAITGTLQALDGEANGWALTDAQKRAASTMPGRNIGLPALLMLATFMLAVVAMMLAGFRLGL